MTPTEARLIRGLENKLKAFQFPDLEMEAIHRSRRTPEKQAAYEAKQARLIAEAQAELDTARNAIAVAEERHRIWLRNAGYLSE